MESENTQLQTLPNGVCLAGTGLAVLITRRLLLAPTDRFSYRQKASVTSPDDRNFAGPGSRSPAT